jgi:predicted nucleic acid-binding protein
VADAAGERREAGRAATSWSARELARLQEQVDRVRWLVDTSVLIDHLRGDLRAVRVLTEAAIDGCELWSVTVVRTEILAGMRRSEEAATKRLLDNLRWVDVDSEVADRAGELARRYLRSHRGVDTVDYLIAAAAEIIGAEVKTQNVKHFPMIAGLKPAYG